MATTTSVPGLSGVGSTPYSGGATTVGPQLAAVLKQYGLQDLTKWASDALVNGLSEDEIMLQMYEQPTFRTRFAGIFAREKAGLPPISIEDYLNYEKVATSLGSTWGLQLSKSEIDGLIGGDVSAQELEQRFNIAASAVYEDTTETKAELQRLFGISEGQLMRYWMNPGAELGILQQQYKMGQIAGASLRSGYGRINAPQALRLQQAGLTEDEALTGFGQLSTMRELFTSLDAGEDMFSQDEQIGLLAGDATTATEVERRGQRRRAEFEGQGGFATGQEGFATGQAD